MSTLGNEIVPWDQARLATLLRGLNRSLQDLIEAL